MTVGKQYPLILPHQDKMTAEDFMITDSNREAAAWVGKWPDWGTPCLILYGPQGSGKTHLSAVWQEQSGAETLAWPDLSEGVGPFLIEEANRCAGDDDAEEALFHLYNRVNGAGHTLLLTAIDPPSQWGVKLPDLLSRLMAAPAVALRAPDDDLIAAILIKQFGDRQIKVESDVVAYLVPRIERSHAAIRSLVERLDAASLSAGRKITIALAREILA